MRFISTPEGALCQLDVTFYTKLICFPGYICVGCQQVAPTTISQKTSQRSAQSKPSRSVLKSDKRQFFNWAEHSQTCLGCPLVQVRKNCLKATTSLMPMVFSTGLTNTSDLHYMAHQFQEVFYFNPPISNYRGWVSDTYAGMTVHLEHAIIDSHVSI